MMCDLVANVLFHRRNTRFAYSESTVTILPRKTGKIGRLFLEPFTRFGLRLLNQIHDSELATQ